MDYLIKEIRTMKKGEYIDKVIGGILYPLGFNKVKNRGCWKYKKEVINKKGETIVLTVIIYKHPYMNGLTMQLCSTAHGQRDKRLGNFGHDDFISYQNDDEFKIVINKIGIILEEKGIAWLESAIEPLSDDYFKDEDYRKLYLEHEQLAVSFAERMNVNIQDISLREAFEVVKNVLMDGSKNSFKEMVPLFLETSAFLAKVESKNYKIEWRLEEYEKQLRCHLFVYNLNGTREKNVNVLGAVLVGWVRKGEDLIKRLVDTFEDYNPNYY